MRRCIIHIGHAKTATTYLQHCLHLNAALLARHNYWLPGDFTAFGFYDLATLSRAGAVISGNLAPLHVLMTDGPGERIPRMEAYLFGAPGMPAESDVLLSSELFFYYTRATAKLIQTAREFGLLPEVIAFLPRQDRASVTGYLQNVRYHGFTQGVVDFLVHDRNMPYCRYMHTLQRLAELAPNTPITLRTFDPTLLAGADVFSDFLAAIGSSVDPAECERPARTSNQGLLLEHYELLRAATILGRTDAAERLRTAEIALTAADRVRLNAYYYRAGVQDFLTQSFQQGNLALLDRFMPQASAAERAHWQQFDPAPAPVELDPAVMEHWRARAFG